MGQAPTQQLAMRAGRSRVAIAADGVAEVIRSPKITRLPHAPAGLLGVSHLRGVVFPVLSLNALLGTAEAETKRVVVLRREPPIGLAVEWVETLKTADHAASPDGALTLIEDQGARAFDLDAALQAQFAALQPAARSPQTPAASAPIQTAVEDLAFMGLSVAGQAYALPLTAVAEVAPVPSEITALPNTDVLLLGMLSMRGQVVALVSLRALLGLPIRAVRPEDRLVVVRIGDHRLALVVDELSAIVRAPADAPRPAPSLFNRGSGEAAIALVLPAADGKGLISILEPERLLADDRLARLLAEPVDQEVEAMASTAAYERFLIVRLGEERFGLPIASIDEVARLPDALTRLPRAPKYVLGVMNLRGRIIPVIDQAQRFAAVDAQVGSAQRVVVTSFDGLQAGFAVDAVSRIIEIDPAEIQPAPRLNDRGDHVIDRVARVEADGEVILLIDPKALLDNAEADLLKTLAAKSAAKSAKS
ncbi:MAG: chemotaxis protein CheW [Caulobacteraceae bacterium]